jgi:antitoxin (DNA-binding transcriptional repressor) of toxin-antitoxin stability system
LLDNLDRDGILITKNGRPLARLIPAEFGCASLIGSMRGKIEIRGDVFSTGHRWRAES